jgi:sialic acid synthase SpsE
MEEELLKAEEQENSLVKIKDLYKDEIKKLIKKNEEQTKAFEEELKNERKRVEESESVHSVEAVKQLYFKIVNIAGFMFTEENISSKRKE